MSQELLQLLTDAIEVAEMAWKINDGEDVDTLNGLAFNLIPKLKAARAAAIAPGAADMTDDALHQKLITTVTAILRPLPIDQRAEGAEYLLALGYELTRGIKGNAYARLWLGEATADLATAPPFIVIREHH